MGEEELEAEKQRLGLRIRAAREDRGWTQETLGHLVGVRDNQVSRWEQGRYLPTRKRVVAIARVTGKPMGYFYPDHRGALTMHERHGEEVLKELGEDSEPVTLAMLLREIRDLRRLIENDISRWR